MLVLGLHTLQYYLPNLSKLSGLLAGYNHTHHFRVAGLQKQCKHLNSDSATARLEETGFKNLDSVLGVAELIHAHKCSADKSKFI